MDENTHVNTMNKSKKLQTQIFSKINPARPYLVDHIINDDYWDPSYTVTVGADTMEKLQMILRSFDRIVDGTDEKLANTYLRKAFPGAEDPLVEEIINELHPCSLEQAKTILIGIETRYYTQTSRQSQYDRDEHIDKGFVIPVKENVSIEYDDAKNAIIYHADVCINEKKYEKLWLRKEYTDTRSYKETPHAHMPGALSQAEYSYLKEMIEVAKKPDPSVYMKYACWADENNSQILSPQKIEEEARGRKMFFTQYCEKQSQELKRQVNRYKYHEINTPKGLCLEDAKEYFEYANIAGEQGTVILSPARIDELDLRPDGCSMSFKDKCKTLAEAIKNNKHIEEKITITGNSSNIKPDKPVRSDITFLDD